MAFRPTQLKPEAELVMKENQERIKLQARQITNRVLNTVLAEHDAEFIERHNNGEVWEVGVASRKEIEGLFRTAAVRELES